ncbi:hypothetical protein Bca52824_004581 [Brassica carinata]|uniref:Protein kinase domain-containing protein n=1 Tax=Brassica carinata TaxID=52824 RepID=A0A8X7WP96_BRACI|nr:hypothetical protein Bca52824_004581 [Brassica carinata]
MSSNLLTGSLPEDVGRLGKLGNLSVAHNKLSGKLPKTLGKRLSMENLELQGNYFEGIIPDISKLMGIKKVDFSTNNLSGRIPEYLANFSLLEYLNLFNNFERNVPTEGKFKNATIVLVSGNKNLCGGFSSSYLIGSGSFGTVFKAFLPAENKVVAVKVLNMQRHGAMRSSMAECESLKDIRLRNLVKLLTACSSIDFQGNEFRALIYDAKWKFGYVAAPKGI